MNPSFWLNRKVLVTGHTGFMGGWLTLALKNLGAEVTGLSLPPSTETNFFTLAGLADGITHVTADIREHEAVAKAMQASQAAVVFHLAAQALVRPSYADPVGTYATNVLGTVHVLEAARQAASVKAVINVTSDKCYENREWVWGYRETDPMGGHDPYSSSKACAEIVTGAYQRSFYLGNSPKGLATVRAGNVIGGGDWAVDRLVPDFIRALVAGEAVHIRSPHAIRPWQHVLEPVYAYLLLAERLVDDPKTYSTAWNLGPDDSDAKSVSWIIDQVCSLWGESARWELDKGEHPHEAHYLKLDCSKSKMQLGWRPRWTLEECLQELVAWYQAWLAGADMKEFSTAQFQRFANLTSRAPGRAT
jgi:CDP-glucose 4,6-dehydratase